MAGKDLSKKKFFTTGQIAKICGVSIATVQKWIDAKEIDSYRLPLTASERRVPRESLLAFMRKYNVPTAEIEARKPYRVLMAHTDKEFRRQVQRAWDDAAEHPEFLVAEEGTTALLEAGSSKANMIVMDIHLTDMNGLRTVELLRTNNFWKDTKIIVCSELSSQEQSFLEKMGVDAIISKPVRPQKLKKILLKASSMD